jgi:hypothetical protein
MTAEGSAIRAFLRVRSLGPKEASAELPLNLVHDPGQGANFVRIAPSGTAAGSAEPQPFREVALDRVLPETASQEEVYRECVAPLVVDCVAGRNVALVACGGRVSSSSLGVSDVSCSPDPHLQTTQPTEPRTHAPPLPQGTGRTFTMFGDDLEECTGLGPLPPSAGMVPRVCEAVFAGIRVRLSSSASRASRACALAA